MKIYTRTGDFGMTSLFSGERVSKDDIIFDLLGSVDEGNSTLGLALSLLPEIESLRQTREQIEIVQHALFDAGASLATPLSCHQPKKIEKTRFDEEAITQLERWIDEIEAQIPPLKTFILPGGHSAGAALHLARSIIRRAERLAVQRHKQEEVPQSIRIYLNRLSDFLFMLSRFVNHQLQIPETLWKPHSHK